MAGIEKEETEPLLKIFHSDLCVSNASEDVTRKPPPTSLMHTECLQQQKTAYSSLCPAMKIKPADRRTKTRCPNTAVQA